jgi:hypothetical protein
MMKKFGRTMRTIIAGSRTCTFYTELLKALFVAGWQPTVVLSGTARGVDRMGEEWAKSHKIPIERYSADWEKYGRRAGHIRNAEMVKNAEALIALWDGKSPGTKDVIEQANNAGLTVYVHRY